MPVYVWNTAEICDVHGWRMHVPRPPGRRLWIPCQLWWSLIIVLRHIKTGNFPPTKMLFHDYKATNAAQKKKDCRKWSTSKWSAVNQKKYQKNLNIKKVRSKNQGIAQKWIIGSGKYGIIERNSPPPNNCPIMVQRNENHWVGPQKTMTMPILKNCCAIWAENSDKITYLSNFEIVE